MSGKSGPGNLKNLRKVKPGYDQEFTLPKGTSAAPIKQVTGRGAEGSVWSKITKKDAKKVKKDTTDLIGDVVIGGGSAGTAAVIAMMIREKMQKEKKKKQRTESRKKQRQGNRNNKRP